MITCLLLQLLVPLDAQAVVEKIDDILSRYEVNWKTLLLVISVIHVCYPLGTKHLKGNYYSFFKRFFNGQ